MDWKLELVVVPVADPDRARRFYETQMGFVIDHDTRTPGGRIIQATPPGSGCSIAFGSALGGMPPGSLSGLQLVVNDLDAAHAFLTGNEVAVSEVSHFGANGPEPGRGEDWNNFLFLSDPDGNAWTIQERPEEG